MVDTEFEEFVYPCTFFCVRDALQVGGLEVWMLGVIEIYMTP